MSFDYYPILSTYSTALTVLTAVLLDALLGEPKRWHPLVGFGQLANALETEQCQQPIYARMNGLLAWFILIAPLSGLAYGLSQTDAGWLNRYSLYYILPLRAKSLLQHAQQIYTPLSQHNLFEARHAIRMIVSRDTAQLMNRKYQPLPLNRYLKMATMRFLGQFSGLSCSVAPAHLHFGLPIP